MKKKLKETEKIGTNEEILIEKTKKISMKEACSYSFMDGFGVRYITPFAVAIGSSNFYIGLLNSIPSLFGNLSQLITLKFMDKWSRKKIVFWGVFLQAIMWLFLILVGAIFFLFNIKNSLSPKLLILFYSLLIFFGAFAGPAWQSWMAEIVKNGRGDYFGKRNRLAGSLIILCTLIAGFILDYSEQYNLFLGFAILFFIAFVGRAASALLMLKQYEPQFKSEKTAYFTLFQFIRKMSYNNFGRFVIYFSLVSFAVAVASPFFAVYMLKELSFTYVEFMIISLVPAITSFLAMPTWGKFADKYGTVTSMRLAAPYTLIIPFLWVATIFFMDFGKIELLSWLIFVEALSGIFWAGFNLSASNFIFDAVSKERLAICAAYFSILNSIGVLLGSTIGGIISSFKFNLFGLNPLLAVFIISGIFRILIFFIMGRKVHEVRAVQEFNLEKTTKLELRKIKNLPIEVRNFTSLSLSKHHLSALREIFDVLRLRGR